MSNKDAGEKRKAEDDSENPVIKAEKGESSTSSSKAAVAAAAADEDPDWDDDRPICELMTEYMKKKVQRAKAKAKEEAEREAAAKAAKASKASSSSGGTRTAAPQRKDAQYYQDTKKGQMVQRLLVRWWYAYEWPKPGDWAESDIPNGYEQLDGFPGVFVSMNVSSLGKIIDLRNNDMKPSLKHMSRKHAKEVQELCIRAYEAQIQALAEAEGEGAPLLHTLRKELHQVKKMDPDDAEREAKSFVF
jgi:hypothetical protein